MKTLRRGCGGAHGRTGGIPSADALSPLSVDPADAARLLLTTVMGLRILARGFPDRAVLEGAARQALSVLGKPIRRRKPSARK
jgi:hypothetical protein